jgi:hypothetical protein
MTLYIGILSTTLSQAYLDKGSNKQSGSFCFTSCDKKVLKHCYKTFYIFNL